MYCRFRACACLSVEVATDVIMHHHHPRSKRIASAASLYPPSSTSRKYRCHNELVEELTAHYNQLGSSAKDFSRHGSRCCTYQLQMFADLTARRCQRDSRLVHHPLLASFICLAFLAREGDRLVILIMSSVHHVVVNKSHDKLAPKTPCFRKRSWHLPVDRTMLKGPTAEPVYLVSHWASTGKWHPVKSGSRHTGRRYQQQVAITKEIY
ncbi:hypothetical protein BJV78DRAFT_543057 [Lactifluus subvellereus]|nr:hypothetical protein BJV78DRAFT_543057 [Lactifluus subvellereus]